MWHPRLESMLRHKRSTSDAQTMRSSKVLSSMLSSGKKIIRLPMKSQMRKFQNLMTFEISMGMISLTHIETRVLVDPATLWASSKQ